MRRRRDADGDVDVDADEDGDDDDGLEDVVDDGEAVAEPVDLRVAEGGDAGDEEETHQDTNSELDLFFLDERRRRQLR